MKEQTRIDLWTVALIVALVAVPALLIFASWALVAFFVIGGLIVVLLSTFLYLRLSYDRAKARRQVTDQ